MIHGQLLLLVEEQHAVCAHLIDEDVQLTSDVIVQLQHSLTLVIHLYISILLAAYVTEVSYLGGAIEAILNTHVSNSLNTQIVTKPDASAEFNVFFSVLKPSNKRFNSEENNS